MKVSISMQEDRLRIAVQKSGRLSDGSFDLLKKCGLTISRGRDKLYARVRELPIDVLLLRDDDIPSFVADRACDVGIVGENVAEEDRMAAERSDEFQIVRKLGFARCNLMIAGPKEWDDDLARLTGARIATTYPGLTDRFLKQEKIDAHSVMMSGSVEVAPRMKIADAVCDIVSTGATLDANGLKPMAQVFQSEAVLIQNNEDLSPAKQDAFDALLKRIDGVIASRHAKYIMMNAPRAAIDAITKVLPGADAPTILELAGENEKVAIHAMCQEEVFWSTLEKLKAEGASAILVLPIEKLMA